jgi:CRP/FNR family transcriptional regulator, anaerobic regulatory protein
MVDIEKLREIFLPFSNDIEDYIHELAPLFTRKKIQAGQNLLRPGQVCRHSFILEKGIVRNYFYKEGKEITSWFDFEGEFVGSLHSYYSQTPSEEGVETITDSIILEMSFEKFDLLSKSNPAFKKLIDIVTLYFIHNLESRGRILQAYSAQERYDLFLEKHPEAINTIPLKFIASFLGITPETLSRIKSKTY